MPGSGSGPAVPPRRSGCNRTPGRPRRSWWPGSCRLRSAAAGWAGSCRCARGEMPGSRTRREQPLRDRHGAGDRCVSDPRRRLVGRLPGVRNAQVQPARGERLDQVIVLVGRRVRRIRAGPDDPEHQVRQHDQDRPAKGVRAAGPAVRRHRRRVAARSRIRPTIAIICMPELDGLAGVAGHRGHTDPRVVVHRHLDDLGSADDGEQQHLQTERRAVHRGLAQDVVGALPGDHPEGAPDVGEVRGVVTAARSSWPRPSCPTAGTGPCWPRPR